MRLVLYGDGELKQSLEQEADKLCISSRVDIHPATLKVHELIKDCTMYVSSSDYEGQSNSMLEAPNLSFFVPAFVAAFLQISAARVPINVQKDSISRFSRNTSHPAFS